MRVLLIAGGWSNEREVSLSGAAQIDVALRHLGHAVERFDPSSGFDGLLTAAQAHDFAFLNLHGCPGEDGLIQAMLDTVGCPYQGAGPAGSLLALNKVAAKQLYRRAGLPTPAWEFLPQPPTPGWRPRLPLPLFVKPTCGGSSLAMTRVTSPDQLTPALETIFRGGWQAVLEPLVPGFEMTCAVLGAPGAEETLPPILIRPCRGEYFDYESKYAPGGAEELCPAPVAPELNARVQELALAAHRVLGLEGYSRTDFMVQDGQPWLLETNTLPGMTPTSLVPRAAAAAGLSFADLIQRLLDLGLERARRRATA